MCAGRLYGAFCRMTFMASQIVEDYDLALGEGGCEYLFDIEGEEFPVDRAVDDKGSIDAIDAQSSDEGERLPVTVRDGSGQALSSRSPAAQWGHVGLDPGLIDEDEPFWCDAMLIGLPAPALASDVRPVLLGR